MHKKTFLVLSLLACVGLSSCSGGSSGEVPEQDEDIKYVNNELIEANLEVDNTIVNVAKCHPETISPKVEDFDIVDSRYENKGLLVVRGTNGYIGFYSLLHKGWLISPVYDPTEIYNYQVISQGIDKLGYILILTFKHEDIFEGTTYENIVVDAFGNLYDFPSNYKYYPDYYTQKVTADGFYYAGACYSQNDDNYMGQHDGIHYNIYYRYDEKGHATRVHEIPEDSYEPVVPPVEDDDYTGPFYGDLYEEGWMDLSYAALANHYLAIEKNQSGYYTVFEGETPISNFYVDTTNEFLGVINGAAYFQKAVELPDDVVAYSFSADSNGKGNIKKYALEQLSVDLKTGVKTELNYSVVFNKFEQINSNKEGEYLQVISYRPITEKLVLGDAESYIADKEFILHDNVSGMHIGKFVKYEFNNEARYFNKNTKILYDKDFKVIANLEEMNPVYKAELNMFEGTKEVKQGVLKKGLVDLNGKVRLTFRYTDIVYDSFYDNVGLVKDGNKVYRVDLKEADSENLVGYNLTKEFEAGDLDYSALYRYSKDEEHVFSALYSVKKGELVIFRAGSEKAGGDELSTIDYLGKNYAKYVRDTEGNICIIKYDDFKPQSIPDSTKLTPIADHLVDGSSTQYALEHTITSDSEYFTIELRALETIYVELEVLSSFREGYYYVSFDEYRLTCVDTSVDYYDDNTIGVYIAYEQPVTIEFECIYSGYPFQNLKSTTQLSVEKDCGTNAKYPLAHTGVGQMNQGTFRSPSSIGQVNTFYVKYTANTEGVYYFKPVTGIVGSIYTIDAKGVETELPDVDYPIYMKANESKTFEIVYTSVASIRSFYFDYAEYKSFTYVNNEQNVIEPSANKEKVFFVSFVAPEDNIYEVVMENISINRMYAKGERIYDYKFEASANEKVVIAIVLDNYQAETLPISINGLYNFVEKFGDYASVELDAGEDSPWVESNGVYTPSNTKLPGSNSTMSVTFAHDGTFFFKYLVEDDQYGSYLEVYRNGSCLFEASDAELTSYFVNVSDKDVIEFVFYKASSFQSGAQVQNFRFATN